VTTLAALVFLLPGLVLTIALTELATRNLISGTGRFTWAFLLFLQLGFGVALGRRVDLLLPAGPGAVPPMVLPTWATFPALVVITLTLAVLFKARLKDAGWILLAGALSYGGGRLGAGLLGPELGAFLGALALGLGSNLFARVFRRPSVITTIPGVMLLVPGSIGFRSLESLLARDVVAGIGTAFNVVMVGVALAAGLLFANSLIAPRKIL